LRIFFFKHRARSSKISHFSSEKCMCMIKIWPALT
jgi:hypothetical protein